MKARKKESEEGSYEGESGCCEGVRVMGEDVREKEDVMRE